MRKYKRGKLFTEKHGQITVFMIIGIIMVVMFGGSYYLMQVAEKVKLQAQADSIVLEALQTSPLRSFVTRCIDKEVKDGLKLLGSQGGNIYVDQGGLVERDFSNQPYYLIGNDYIDYGVLNQPYGFFLNPPLYPSISWNGRFDYVDNLNGQWPFFGKNNLKSLCDPDGENAPGKSIVICRSYGEDSIQEQLRSYVVRNLPGCANFSSISESFNFSAGIPEVFITLTEDDVVVKVSYPVKVRIGNSDVVLSIADFTKVVNVRLKKVYDFVYELLNHEVYDLKFDIVKDYDFTGLWDSFISVNKTRPQYVKGVAVSTACRATTVSDSLIIVEDKSSLLKGDPFKFSFVIQNRNPVLDWIPSIRQSKKFDIIVLEGNNLTINPKGYDPDEEKINYSYYGWKENYDEKFNDCNCNFECKNNITTFRERCVVRNDNVPHNWTRSELFKNSRKAAVLKNLTHQDIGPHNLIIKITDSDGCSDWQNISVLVTDLPVVNANASGSDYEDMTTGLASIEDPYTLNASMSTLIFGTLSYLWIDPMEGWTLLHEDPVTGVKLPTGKYNINNIKNKHNFTKIGKHNITLNANGKKLKYDVNVYECLPYKGKNTANFGTPFKADKPWPYNKTVPAFKTAHICCNGYGDLEEYDENNNQQWDKKEIKKWNKEKQQLNTADCETDESCSSFKISQTDPNGNPTKYEIKNGAWGSYKKTSEVCYTEELEGSILDLMNPDGTIKSYPDVEPSSVLFNVGSQTYSLDDLPKENQNDLFKLTFEVHCSGERGNICNGDATVTLTLKEERDDFSDINQDERCVRATAQDITGFPPKYKYYDSGESFEKEAETLGFTFYKEKTGRNLNGICNEGFQFSSATTYNDGGPYYCQANCTGGGKCEQPINCYCLSLTEKSCNYIPKNIFDNQNTITFEQIPNIVITLSDLTQTETNTQREVGTSYCNANNELLQCNTDCEVTTTNTFAKILNTNCQADQACDGKSAGKGIKTNSNNQKISPSTCPNFDPSTGCSNLFISEDTVGCNSTGQYINCFPYKFNTNTNECKTTADSENDCFGDITNTNGDVTFKTGRDNTRCLVCEPNGVLTDQIPYNNINSPYNTGVCSKHCEDVDSQCDGKEPGSSNCNENCKYSGCTNYCIGITDTSICNENCNLICGQKISGRAKNLGYPTSTCADKDWTIVTNNNYYEDESCTGIEVNGICVPILDKTSVDPLSDDFVSIGTSNKITIMAGSEKVLIETNGNCHDSFEYFSNSLGYVSIHDFKSGIIHDSLSSCEYWAFKI